MDREVDGSAQAEIAEIERRFGPALYVDSAIPEFRVGDWRPQGSEVCMVVRRPAGTLLTMLKTFYPRGAHRLPTGGIDPGEAILDGLRRELREETGLAVAVRRFLCHVAYRRDGQAGPPVFHTFAFLVDETGGTLTTLDEHERVEEWREIDPRELLAIAGRLERVDGATASEPGDWAAWGRFRAVAHRAVYEALLRPPGAQTEAPQRRGRAPGPEGGVSPTEGRT